MKKRGLISVAAAAALAAASLVAVAPASNAAAKTITLAFQGPLTGEEASVGQDELAGMLYAVKLFNAKNKGKYVVKVVQADDQISAPLSRRLNIMPSSGLELHRITRSVWCRELKQEL